jgi:hypothetical protein
MIIADENFEKARLRASDSSLLALELYLGATEERLTG